MLTMVRTAAAGNSASSTFYEMEIEWDEGDRTQRKADLSRKISFEKMGIGAEHLETVLSVLRPKLG